VRSAPHVLCDLRRCFGFWQLSRHPLVVTRSVSCLAIDKECKEEMQQGVKLRIHMVVVLDSLNCKRGPVFILLSASFLPLPLLNGPQRRDLASCCFDTLTPFCTHLTDKLSFQVCACVPHMAQVWPHPINPTPSRHLPRVRPPCAHHFCVDCELATLQFY